MKGLVITYLLTYGGSAVALFEPFVGLLIYVGFAIIKPESMWHWSVEPGNYSRIIAIALLVGWALRGFGDWRLGKAFGITMAFVGFLIWAGFQAIFADNQTVAWAWVESLAKIVLPFVAGITLIDSVGKLKQLAWVIVVAQGYLAYELNLYYLGGLNVARDVGFAGMDNNSIAVGMVTGVGVAFFLGLGTKNLFGKGFAFLAALMMAHVVLFSYSRGGMLALIITGMAGFLITPRRPFHYVLFAITVGLVLSLAGAEVRDRFLSTFVEEEVRDTSAQSRIALWEDNWELMMRHPLTGVGPHHWPLVANQFDDHEGNPWPDGKEGHSLWLQIGAELGFIGLGLLVFFYASSLLRLWPLTFQFVPVADPWFRDVARMVFAALAGFAVAAQFVSLTFLEVPYYVTLLGAGALKLHSERSSQNFVFDESSAAEP